jgi:hypothetical protein
LKLAPVTAVTGACWEGYGSAAECCGSALAPPRWSASCREEGDWEGALGAFLLLPPLLTAWVGAGEAGVDRGTVQQHGSSAWASSNSDLYSNSRFGLISSASVRRNARKSLKFKFLKFSSLGTQPIGQGILSYFCFKERRSFEEILFQILI